MDDLRAFMLAIMLIIGAGFIITAMFYIATVVVPVLVAAGILLVVYMAIKEDGDRL